MEYRIFVSNIASKSDGTFLNGINNVAFAYGFARFHP